MVRKQTKWLLSLPVGWALTVGGYAAADELPSAPIDGGSKLVEAGSPADLSSDELANPTTEAAPPAADGATPAPAPLQTEIVTERYPNRNVKIERHVAQDLDRNFVNHGAWTMWDVQGKLLGSGQYDMGKRQGKWVRYYPEAKAHDLFFGPIDKEFATPFVSNASFDGDVLHGGWSLVDAKGKKIATWELDHGKLNGKSVWYYPNGHERLVLTYKLEVLDGEAIEFAADGTVIRRDKYADGRKLAPYVKKYKSGAKQIEGYYIQARELYSTQIDWWNGVVRIEVSGKEGNDVKHGKWIAYYEDGGRQYEREYHEDLPIGKHFAWYPNGQKAMEGTFTEGKRDGLWVWWHGNGQRHVEGSYTAGVENGTWVKWNESGKVAEVQEHKLNTPANVATRPDRPDVDSAPEVEGQPIQFPQPVDSSRR